ncbi:MAG: single-stranded DNA-binding protein [Chitinophagales bacterium]|nr:single-stranded DNA-binding protein [Chitinophagales bacterium]
MNTVKNFVQLVGNLGRNPEVKTFENGNAIAKFSLATSDSYTNKLGEKVQDTQWHNVVAWGKLAKVAEEQLEKGKEVSIKGKISYKNYEDKNGVKKIFTEIIAEEIECIDRPVQTAS